MGTSPGRRRVGERVVATFAVAGALTTAAIVTGCSGGQPVAEETPATISPEAVWAENLCFSAERFRTSLESSTSAAASLTTGDEVYATMSGTLEELGVAISGLGEAVGSPGAPADPGSEAFISRVRTASEQVQAQVLALKMQVNGDAASDPAAAAAVAPTLAPAVDGIRVAIEPSLTELVSGAEGSTVRLRLENHVACDGLLGAPPATTSPSGTKPR